MLNVEQLTPRPYEYPTFGYCVHCHPLSPKDILFRAGRPPVTPRYSAFFPVRR